MTRDKKNAEERTNPASPAAAPTPAEPAVTTPAEQEPTTTTTPAKPEAPVLTRVEYTGQTAGSIRTVEGQVLVRHVEPGDVIEPADDKERKALLGTGHFALTRHRATTDTTTDAETRRIAEEAAQAAAEEKK